MNTRTRILTVLLVTGAVAGGTAPSALASYGTGHAQTPNSYGKG